MWFRSTLCFMAFLATSLMANAFVVPRRESSKPLTRRYLEDWVADMIDGEVYRQSHKKEFEQKWMEKNRGAILHQLSFGNDFASLEEEEQVFRQELKDKRLAETNPQQYCADRCIATGNCDVYEDIFHFSPEEVIQFCSDCVLATEEEECEIPDAFFDLDLLKP